MDVFTAFFLFPRLAPKGFDMKNEPEKIKITGILGYHPRNFAEIVFLRVLEMKLKEMGTNDITKVAPNLPENGEDMEISLVINGVHMPFIETMEEFRQAIGDMDKRQVEEWFNEKFGSLADILDPLEKLLKDTRSRMITEVLMIMDEKFPGTKHLRDQEWD